MKLKLKLATLLFAAFATTQVFAFTSTDPFELDANALQETTADDWSNVVVSPWGNSVAHTGVLPDPAPLTAFLGGKKDTQDPSEWGYNDGASPDKNDITNAYAAAYTVNGDLIVAFGADRYANNGDAFLGFWLFKDNVKAENGKFSGHHTPGDVLIVVNYPQGANATPENLVYVWDPTVKNNLRLKTSTKTKCNGGDFDVCSITNSAPVTAPWSYAAKDGSTTTFPAESFFEGAINITKLFGAEANCFSSFMTESRSSGQTFTATLKDFVLGAFPVCGISVEKTCEVSRLTTSSDNTSKYFLATFNGTVTNTGAGAIPAGEVVTIVDDAGTVSDTSDDVTKTVTLASALSPGQSINVSGQFFTDLNPPFNKITASVTYGTATITADPYGVSCTPLPLNPGLTITKSCEAAFESDTSGLHVKVDYFGTVCNTGNVPLLVTGTDDKDGTVYGPKTLAAKTNGVPTCENITGSYIPDATDGDEPIICDATFTDTITVTGTSPVLTSAVTNSASATCGCGATDTCTPK